MKMSENITELAAALALAQAEMENAAKTSKNPHFKSTYADLAEIVNVSRPVLGNHGLSLLQSPGYADGIATVTNLLLHSSGQWIMDTAAAPVGKADAQGVGSVITYLRRYSRAAICGLAQEDDDGNAASRHKTQREDPAGPTPKQQAMIDECKRAVDDAETVEQLRVMFQTASDGGYLEWVADYIKARKAQLQKAAA